MASKSDLRELGDKYSVKAAMVILSKSKEKLLKKTELEECLKISTVAKHLQNIAVDDSIVNKEACFKTIFNLCQKFKAKSDLGTLTQYLDFIFANVNGKYPHLDVVDSLSDIEEDFDENIELVAEAIAMDESVFTPSESSSKDVKSTTLTLTSSLTEKSASASASANPAVTITAKPLLKAPSLEKETDTSTSSAPVKRITLKSSVVKINLQEGENIYLKGGEINYARYKETDLAKVYNKNAKLFILDIETCKDTIYPVAVDLSPNSTIKDALAYIGKVLKEAGSKSLKCHTDLHVYKISNLMENDRVTYLSIKH